MKSITLIIDHLIKKQFYEDEDDHMDRIETAVKGIESQYNQEEYLSKKQENGQTWKLMKLYGSNHIRSF